MRNDCHTRAISRVTRGPIVPLILVLGMLSACGHPKEPDEHGALRQELTDSLTLLAQQADFNGFGVVLVNEDTVLYQNGFGMANIVTQEKYTEHTLQAIASISKTFIGIAVLKAQEMGKLKLDDPIDSYLPFTVRNPYYPEVPITIRHLVTHTSTINDTVNYYEEAYIIHHSVDVPEGLRLDISPCRFSPPNADVPMEKFLRERLSANGKRYLKGGFLPRRPGELYNYSNMGATLAALVLEKATGTPFDAFIKQYILDPLGMKASGEGLGMVDVSKHSKLYLSDRKRSYPLYTCITYPDGSLITSTEDMAKYMVELMRGHQGKGNLLSQASYAEYFRPQLQAENFLERNAENVYNDEYNMGITMGFSAKGYFGHTGGDPGMFSMMFFNEATGLGRYMIVNTDMDNWAMHARIWSLLERYGERLNTAPSLGSL